MSRIFSVIVPLYKRKFIQAVHCCLLFNALFVSSPVLAGNFAVSPIRLVFDAENRNAAITIRNEAKSDLNVQIALYEWTQGKDGKDSYKKSDDLLYFPRLAKIHAGESRVVRVGLKGVSPQREEKQYRLYVEELPGQTKAKGMALAVAVRFGVPIFVKPVVIRSSGNIEKLGMDKGQIGLVIRNTGNIHFKITSIRVDSGESYSDELTGWYLLPGARRKYQIVVPEGKCASLKQVNIKVKTDLLELQDALSITPDLCSK